MCEMTKKANIGKVNGKHIGEVYPIQNQTLPYAKVQKHHCAWTNEYLGPEYVGTNGHCTKAFREDIYRNIVGNLRDNCALCGTDLPKAKRDAQRTQHREIINHFCDECVEYLGHVYRKVAGENNSYLADEQLQIAHSPVFGALPAPSHSLRVPDFAQQRQPVPATYNGKKVVTILPTGTWSDR